MTDLIEAAEMIKDEWYSLPFDEIQKRADAILEQRDDWCREILECSAWVRFRDLLSRLPVLWRLGKSVHTYYLENYPERARDVQRAVSAKLVVPISGWRKPGGSR